MASSKYFPENIFATQIYISENIFWK